MSVKVKKQIIQFKENDCKPSYLDKLSESDLSKMIEVLNNNYYNNYYNDKLSSCTQSSQTSLLFDDLFLKDEEYDIIKEYMEKHYPSNKILKQVGAKITSKNKMKLPYFMGSLDKIKNDNLTAFENWLSKHNGPYIITPKIDGVSGLYILENINKNANEEACISSYISKKLMTRGDGTYGQDISHLIPYIYSLPEIPLTANINKIAIRGEFVMYNSVFNEKYSSSFSNARNLVSGIINSKQVDNKIEDIVFICHEIIEPVMKPSEQIQFLNNMEKSCGIHLLQRDNLNINMLTEMLIDLKENENKILKYEIDGLVITDDKIYKRTTENPKYSFAFKMLSTEQVKETTVIDIIWNPSKDGYLKPQIKIEPVMIGGVEVKYATGFNASFVYNNKIRKGSIVKIVRSGDVIPHIIEVINPVSKLNNIETSCFGEVDDDDNDDDDSQILMPKGVMYKWNDTKIDIILEEKENNIDVIEKNITFFFKGLKIDNISSGLVKRLIENNYDTIPKILNMQIDDYLNIPGFQEKLSTKIYNNIKEGISKCSMIDLMSSSNMFGRGISNKKINAILEVYPDILVSKETEKEKIEKILLVKGFSDKTAILFVQSIPSFLKFLNEINININSNANTNANTNANANTNDNTNNEYDDNIKNENNKTTYTEKTAKTSITKPYKLIIIEDDINDINFKENKQLEQKEQHELRGKTVVFSGFRNSELSKKLKNIGCKEGERISVNNTFLLVVKNEECLQNSTSKKIKDAIKNNISIIELKDFTSKYNLL